MTIYAVSIKSHDAGFLIEMTGSDGSLASGRFEGAGDLFSDNTAIRLSNTLTAHLGVRCLTDEQAESADSPVDDYKGLFAVSLGEFWEVSAEDPILYVDWDDLEDSVPDFTIEYLTKALVKGGLEKAIAARLTALQDSLTAEGRVTHLYSQHWQVLAL